MGVSLRASPPEGRTRVMRGQRDKLSRNSCTPGVGQGCGGRSTGRPASRGARRPRHGVGRPFWGPSALHLPAGPSTPRVPEAPPWRRLLPCPRASPALPPGANRVHVSLRAEGPPSDSSCPPLWALVAILPPLWPGPGGDPAAHPWSEPLPLLPLCPARWTGALGGGRGRVPGGRVPCPSGQRLSGGCSRTRW